MHKLLLAQQSNRRHWGFEANGTSGASQEASTFRDLEELRPRGPLVSSRLAGRPILP